MELELYTDADHTNDRAARKSVSGVIVKLNGEPVTWITKKQSVVAASTTEAEYIAMAVGVQEAKWLVMLLTQMGLTVKPNALLHCDNQSAIVNSQDDQNHDRTKHVDIKYHIVRSAVESGLVLVQYIPSGDQQADILTKALQAGPFNNIRQHLLTA